ncbi:20092_t:CDS:2 [Funneliformis geosporum]|nr:20092_t:CDS:2 [Funneliformis geosporum]
MKGLPGAYHVAVYLGNKRVAHIGSSNEFLHSTDEEQLKLIRHHSIIPFQRPTKIQENLTKAIVGNYGAETYKLFSQNCEHFATLYLATVIENCGEQILEGINIPVECYPNEYLTNKVQEAQAKFINNRKERIKSLKLSIPTSDTNSELSFRTNSLHGSTASLISSTKNNQVLVINKVVLYAVRLFEYKDKKLIELKRYAKNKIGYPTLENKDQVVELADTSGIENFYTITQYLTRTIPVIGAGLAIEGETQMGAIIAGVSLYADYLISRGKEKLFKSEEKKEKLVEFNKEIDDKENLEDVKNPNSDVDFLIFKQAIATGWDCPRSHILVKFRQAKSEIFEVQTVGRIMRMPELKHYEEEKLNRAYVYANLEEITIEENALEYLKTKKAKRKKDYRDINLKSVYLMRGEYNDLMFNYRKYFFNKFIEEIGGKLDENEARNNSNLLRKYKSADGTNFILDAKNIEEKIIVNQIIKNVDKENQNIKAEDQNRVKMGTEEIGRNFIAFLKKNCGEFQPARSFEKIRVSIYQLFDKYLGIKNTDKLYIQEVVLSNLGFFQNIIQDSVKEYAKYRKRVEKQYKEISNWNVPAEDYYSKNAVEESYKKCIMEPAYTSQRWKTEIGIPYTDERGKLATFYPDFIVYYKDNRIGIFDPKEGQTAKSNDTKLKAEALQKYIKENKEKRLFGGIVKSDKENRI